MAAGLADLYHVLPWSFAVTLTVPPGEFRAASKTWGGLQELSVLTAHRPLDHQTFYLYSLAEQPISGEPHAHLLLGNVSRDDVDRVVARWPHPETRISAVYHRWSALHYLVAQSRVSRSSFPRGKQGKDDYIAAVVAEHYADWESYCHALLGPPGESDNLESILQMAWSRIRATRQQAALVKRGGQRLGGLLAASRMTREQRVARAKNAAVARWTKSG